MQTYISILLFFCLPLSIQAQHLSLYETQSIYDHPDDTRTYGFISLSESYQLSDHPDSLAIPKNTYNKDNPDEYIILSEKYRRRLLNGLSLSESDTLSIYNYRQNILHQFQVKDLKAVALLSPYDVGGPTTQHEYYIGFEFKASTIESLDDLFAYVGKNHPFTNEPLEPIIWTPIDSSCFPTGYKSQRLKQLTAKTTIKNTYVFHSKQFDYYIQEFADKSWGIRIRHLLIIERITNTIHLNQIQSNSESSELNTLSISTQKDLIVEHMHQWTGNMFKNQPPVFLGFQHFSFGCQSIQFIQTPMRSISVKCDNRH